MKMDEKKFIEEIFHEFILTIKPVAGAISHVSDWDSEAIEHDFSTWLEQPVPDDVLIEHAKSLPAFTPKAFVFFLKDYLIYGLRYPDSELAEHLIYRLSAANQEEDYWKQRLLLLSARQKEIIAVWCECMIKKLSNEEIFLREKLVQASQFWYLIV